MSTKPASAQGTMPVAPVAVPAADLGAIKSRQQATWASGDYSVIARTLAVVAESLCETVDVRAGERVLDVAAGTGNAAIAAARRYADVTASDFVPALLEHARMRAQTEGLLLTLREADAEALPFPEASFDVVLSTYGVMFTPDQERAAQELVRVCRPGGRIGLANWTPDGFIGQLFRLIGRYVPPPPGLRSPALWGTAERLHELFGGAAVSVSVTPREFVFRYQSGQHWIDVFRAFYGPVHKAFGALDDSRQRTLTNEILELLARFDRGEGAGIAVAGSYIEAVITRR